MEPQGERDPVIVFTRIFAEIEEPFEAVEAAMLQDPEGWVTDPDARAARRGSVSGPINVRVGAAGLTKTVRLTLGQPDRQPTKTSVPVSWEATRASGLFPHLSGILEISRFGPRQTLLALLVEYQPPFGKLGEMLDQALLHRIAWATLSDFRDRVAAALTAIAHEGSSTLTAGYSG